MCQMISYCWMFWLWRNNSTSIHCGILMILIWLKLQKLQKCGVLTVTCNCWRMLLQLKIKLTFHQEWVTVSCCMMSPWLRVPWIICWENVPHPEFPAISLHIKDPSCLCPLWAIMWCLLRNITRCSASLSLIWGSLLILRMTVNHHQHLPVVFRQLHFHPYTRFLVLQNLCINTTFPEKIVKWSLWGTRNSLLRLRRKSARSQTCTISGGLTETRIQNWFISLLTWIMCLHWTRLD